MLLVLATCAKDVGLSISALKWAIKLDTRIPFVGVLHAETDTPLDELQRLASAYFERVIVHRIDKYTGDPRWPRPQNYAWQSAARFMSSLQDVWLWWEPDLVPLRAGWAQELDAEYKRAGRPFMGRVSERGLAGCALYPPDVSRHSTAPLLCRTAPFDATLWPDIKDKTHPANHLIGLHPRYTRVTLRVVARDVAERLATRYAVFHGVNDGSLAAVLAGQRPPEAPKGALVRVLDAPDIDADADESEAVWQRDALDLSAAGYAPHLPYRQTQAELPSVAQQGWQVGFVALPATHVQVYFNAALVPSLAPTPERPWQLVTRRWTRTPAGPWHSDLVAWTLDADFYPSAPVELRFPKQRPGHQREDPRVVAAGNKFLVCYAHWQQGRVYTAQQAFAWFNAGWQFQSGFSIAYGGNGWSEALAGPTHEKNWAPFFHEGVLHIQYGIVPHVVLRADTPTSVRKYESTPKALPWAYGELRGGTPPLRVGNEYITFPHSAYAWRKHQKRYVTGALAFQAKAPFALTRVAREPLLSGSEQDRIWKLGPPTAYAVGAVLDGPDILLSLGIGDERVAIARLPWARVDALLKKC